MRVSDSHALPAEQEPQQLRCRDGLDLGAQAVQGIAMDTREQTTVAPLAHLWAGREAAPQHQTARLERGQRALHVLGRPARRRRQLRDRDRTGDLHPATQQVFERSLARPRARVRLRHLQLRIDTHDAERGTDLRQTLGRDPQHGPGGGHSSRATAPGQLVEQPLPRHAAPAFPAFRLEQEAPKSAARRAARPHSRDPDVPRRAPARSPPRPARPGRPHRGLGRAARLHRLRTTLLERRIVEECIGRAFRISWQRAKATACPARRTRSLRR